MQNLEKMEILAPAGSREAFLAAVNSGADAVYLAAKSFGARAYANNFELDELANLLRWAHLRGVAVYLAMNTLLTDEELPEALALAVQLHNLGADALIVQDWGFASQLRRLYPEITLNASTQMTLHNLAAVRQAETVGFARVILAREVSLADITAICEQSETEIEVFGHGALCICFSGQCLFSSLVGGRSGNRGRCAQPCRLKYQLYQKPGRPVGTAGHLLSPKDLNAIELLPELAAAGVRSLKIEGRMKRPEYVAAVTAAYAAAKQGKPYAAQALRQAFNRDFTQAYLTEQPGRDLMSYERPNNRGVKLGRLEQVTPDALVVKLEAPLHIGDGLEIWVSRGGRQGFVVQELKELGQGRVRLPLRGLQGALQLQNLAVGDRVFKTADSELQAAGEAAAVAYDSLPLQLHFVGLLDDKPILQAVYTAPDGEKTEVSVSADYQIPLAEKRPANLALLQKQLGRLGGSGWYLAELSASMDEGIMLPASVLNQLRRDAVQALEAEMLAKWRQQNKWQPVQAAEKMLESSVELQPKPQSFNQPAKVSRPQLAVLVDSLAAAEAAVDAGADLLYWRGWQQRPSDKQPTAQELKKLADLGAFGVLPTIALQAELPLWRKRLAAWWQAGIVGVLLNNLWSFELLAEMPDWRPQLVADFGLNTFNAASLKAWLGKGASRVAISRELNGKQIAQLCQRLGKLAKPAVEVQVFGNLEMMNSRHCPLGAIGGGRTAEQPCNSFCRQGEFYLQDEKGFRFPVCGDEFCRSHIYNGYQLCLVEELPQLLLCSGLAVLRLDLQYYAAENVGQICQIWRKALSLAEAGKEAGLPNLKQQLAECTAAKFTKGHFFRGVE